MSHQYPRNEGLSSCLNHRVYHNDTLNILHGGRHQVVEDLGRVDPGQAQQVHVPRVGEGCEDFEIQFVELGVLQ